MKTQIKQPQAVSHTIQSKTRAANQTNVQRILQKPSPTPSQGGEITQRESLPEEEELLQGKFATAQREELPEEDELLQGKFETAQRETIDDEDEPVQQKAENKTGLPDQLKSGVENLSGYSLDAVRVHYNSPKPAQLQALAYTQGTDIHVAPRQEQHLPHEAWHVVQQMQERVQPTTQLQGVNINDNEGLEKEADVMGGKAEQNRTNAVQLFKVPDGLQYLTNEVNKISKDIEISNLPNGTGVDDVLYGSEEWGKDTYWAANRKLDEWNLVKDLVSSGSNITDASLIGFGISDTLEADGIGYNSDKSIAIAGENKIVSGGFSQINDNLNNALSQLTEGIRAGQYDGITLIAKIHISKGSEAYKHLKEMNTSVLKGQKTRWLNRLSNAYKEGITNWKSTCKLALIIGSGSEIFFNENIE